MSNTINGRTPDEIKKGLDTCIGEDECCARCSYIVYGDCRTALEVDALKYIQHLEAAQPKWISVEDELPPVGEKVLVCANNVMVMAFIDCEDVWHRETITFRLPGAVTHWMPLPEAPKEEA